MLHREYAAGNHTHHVPQDKVALYSALVMVSELHPLSATQGNTVSLIHTTEQCFAKRVHGIRACMHVQLRTTVVWPIRLQ